MKRSSRDAADHIRRCVILAEAGDYSFLEVRTHFRERMNARHLFWHDVVPILLEPDRVEARGHDENDRQQIWLFGRLHDDGEVRIVCSIDWDTRLITLNWN